MNPAMMGMLQQMQAMQAQAAAREVVGQAGGGAVKVVANGALDVVRVQVSEAALADRELLEDLLVVATNDALRQAREVMAGQMGGLLGGMGGLFGG